MPKRIVIADDNPTFRKALRQLLEGVDHWEIVEARDGQEAVTKAVETRPDVIVLDLAMPGKDGFAAAREISQLLPATPILMCTMHSSPQVEIEAQKSGISKVLSKTDSTLILATIRQLLNPEAAAIEDTAVQDAASEAIAPSVLEATNVAAPALAPSAPETPAADPANPLPKNVA